MANLSKITQAKLYAERILRMVQDENKDSWDNATQAVHDLYKAALSCKGYYKSVKHAREMIAAQIRGSFTLYEAMFNVGEHWSPEIVGRVKTAVYLALYGMDTQDTADQVDILFNQVATKINSLLPAVERQPQLASDIAADMARLMGGYKVNEPQTELPAIAEPDPDDRLD